MPRKEGFVENGEELRRRRKQNTDLKKFHSVEEAAGGHAEEWATPEPDGGRSN